MSDEITIPVEDKYYVIKLLEIGGKTVGKIICDLLESEEECTFSNSKFGAIVRIPVSNIQYNLILSLKKEEL